ncbi:MAG TPA: hypothetical protein VFW00_06190 [Rhodocyclaceae bacterium]|nr:hypothetical protein [Rhodocyclaceae bacterium]
MPFKIESTTYCPNGIAPRWTWWIHGIAGTQRYGVVGTDEQGHGLYLYEAHGDHIPDKVLLLTAGDFSLPDNTPKEEAALRLTTALVALGWNIESAVKTVTARSKSIMPAALTPITPD